MSSKWKSWRNNLANVLGMNRRNLHYIYPNNQRSDYPAADNKLITKKLLQEAGLPVAKTYHVFQYFHQMSHFQQDIANLDSFVIKPARGRGGGGIKVIASKKNESWQDTNGNTVSLEQMRKQILDIIFGVYSFDTQDVAIIEEKISQHVAINAIYNHGLSDVRVIICQHRIVMTMIRIPTDLSDGRANMHQGAIGIGIDINTGITQSAILNGNTLARHPDSNSDLLNLQIPHWTEVMDLCVKISHIMPLKYLGVDIAITNEGPQVIEVNVRPGLEIQNANQNGLRAILEGIRNDSNQYE